jgi:transcriptional regulator with XRE-family HTH domain
MSEVSLKPDGAEMGRMLRAVRERTGRKQADVAAAARISPSMLSQIERGRVSPSIETLLELCRVLEFNVSELFRRLSPGRPVRIVRPENRLRSGRRGIRYAQLVNSVDPSHPAEMFLLEVNAGRQLGISGRGHEGVELGSVLSGTARLTVDGVEHTLKEGDSVSFSSRLPHRLVNAGQSVFRAIWTVLPPHHDYLHTGEHEQEGSDSE